ncbi:MAG: TetR family transcriptional regulator [Planctomycetota bacterium]
MSNVGKSAAETPRAEKAAVDQNGRPLGPRALHTRRRLLDTTVALLDSSSVRDISVVEITRRAGTSPATFYQYFKDVSEATLCLAEEAANDVPAVIELIGGSWRGQKGMETSRAIADAFVHHWDAYRAVLLVRNLAADEGERRFQKVRRRALAPLLEALAKKIEECQPAACEAGDVHPYAAGAALAAILERLAAYHKELEPLGVTRDDLVENCARIMYLTVTGRPAPSSTAG